MENEVAWKDKLFVICVAIIFSMGLGLAITLLILGVRGLYRFTQSVAVLKSQVAKLTQSNNGIIQNIHYINGQNDWIIDHLTH